MAPPTPLVVEIGGNPTLLVPVTGGQSAVADEKAAAGRS
jgi:hypothetical protein